MNRRNSEPDKQISGGDRAYMRNTRYAKWRPESKSIAIQEEEIGLEMLKRRKIELKRALKSGSDVFSSLDKQYAPLSGDVGIECAQTNRVDN